MAVDTMEYLDYYSVQADTFCIMCEFVGPLVSRITHAGSSIILICCDAPLVCGFWGLSHIDNLWHCLITDTISGRIGANQTVVFPQMVSTNLNWGMQGNSLSRGFP